MSTRRRTPVQESGSKVTPFVLGALAGGIVGAALALLYAPAAGDEVRRGVGEKFDDLTESLNEILRNAKISAEKMLDEGRGTAEDIIDETENQVDDFIDGAKNAISEARRRGKNAASALSGADCDESDGSIGSNGTTESGYPSGHEGHL